MAESGARTRRVVEVVIKVFFINLSSGFILRVWQNKIKRLKWRLEPKAVLGFHGLDGFTQNLGAVRAM